MAFHLLKSLLLLSFWAFYQLPLRHFSIDVSTDERIAKLDALEGSMRLASNLVNYKARIENKTDCLIDPIIEVAGESITLRCGYPCPHPNSITNAVDVDESFNWIGGNCAGRLGAIDGKLPTLLIPATVKFGMRQLDQKTAHRFTR